MERLHRDEFWRVESEYWDADVDENGFYMGTETFKRGSSVPYPSRELAEKAALVALGYGDWVKITHYPSPFDEQG